MEFQILTTDTYTANGHIYPKEMMAEIIAKFNESKLPMLCEMDPEIGQVYTTPLADISHEVTEMRLEGNKVFATINVLNTPKGQIMKNLLEMKNHDFVFRPFGTGNLGCDGIIEDYNMFGVAMMHKDDAA